MPEQTEPEDNVLFVTLDSCRLDTVAMADTPALDSLGPMLPAETSGTFTLPAHWSYFSGFLPQPVQPVHYLDRYERLWRAHAARMWKRTTYRTFGTRTIVEHYAEAGWRTAGLGGVPFFDPAAPSNSLPALFPVFTYGGEPAGQAPTPIDEHLPARRRLPSTLAVDWLRDLARHEPFFGFVNFPETHFPYATPAVGRLDAQLVETLHLYGKQMDLKRPLLPGDPLARAGRLAALHRLQARALEWVDATMAGMFAVLAGCSRPTLVVVCADHGEAFGERGAVGHGHSTPEVLSVPLWVQRLPQ